MAHFSDKAKASVRPTKDELKLLSQHLSSRSVDDLRKVIELAINDTPEVAQIFTKVMRAANMLPSNQAQPVQQHPVIFCDENSYNDGLLTPVDSSEDSEMSGTEGAQVSTRAHSYFQPRQANTPAFCFQSPSQIGPDSAILQRRSNKRKSLAERDDNTASGRSWAANPQTPSSTGIKKSRAAPFGNLPTTYSNGTPCLNCGKSVAAHQWDLPQACIYHPGTFERHPMPSLSTGFQSHAQRGTWSCCRAGFSDHGCLASRHRDVAVNGSSCASQFGGFVKSGELHGIH